MLPGNTSASITQIRNGDFAQSEPQPEKDFTKRWRAEAGNRHL